ncbi:hypothetical protein Kpho02_18350 [Kitasatospora phosalacinea]|uniref:Gram-positive cocci surface proteins LPxTG domain-containing protein n=1 Tax=Kitasatospora phosalacinea TaxID=2065 RepID=A0A9W6Q683_9ACTN|nr:hypothetical protein Kpho02_18350 [Kitasatospora phosalacinea]
MRAAAALLLAAGPVVVAPHAAADPPTGGTVIVDETFTGSSVPDPSWEPLGDTCLTGAPPGSTPAPADAPIPSCPAGGTPAAPVPGATPGYLQLNDSAGFVGGSLLYRRPVPASAGLSVTFEQYQYGGNQQPGDGIGFYLVDGSTPLDSKGADGGSLGYAQRNLSPGVVGGYLGIGLDMYGNFYNDGEMRGADCPAGQQSPVRVDGPVAPNAITLRGPGAGISGYCYLASTTEPPVGDPPRAASTLPGSLGTPYGTTDPAAAKRTVNVQITPAPAPRVIVEVDFEDGTGWHRVLDEPAPAGLPSTYKFGFSASTGGSTDVHLIRNVNAASILPLGDLDLVKQVDRSGPPLPAVITAGTVVPYQYVVTNAGAVEVGSLSVVDDRLAPVDCPATTLPPAPEPGSTVVCTGSYTVTAADVAAGRVVNTATATAVPAIGDRVRAEPSTVTVPLVSAMTLDKQAVTPAPHTVGQVVDYTFTVTDTGGSALSTVVVQDPGITDLSCPTAVLEPGGSLVCTGSHTVTEADLAAGSFRNTATAAARSPIGQTVTAEPSTATVPVVAVADLAVAVDADPKVLPVGSTTTFTVTLHNNGPADATGAVVDNPVPAGTTLLTATPAPGTSYDPATGAWSVPALPSGGSVQLTLQVRLDAAAPATDTATVTAVDQYDPVRENDTARATVRPLDETDIAIGKSVDPARQQVGGQAVFTVTATNGGPAPATGLAVTDLLPAGLELVAAEPDTGSYAAATGVWTIGNLAVGDRARLLLTARAVEPGVRVNTAGLSALDQRDTDPSDNSASATVTVDGPSPSPTPTPSPSPSPSPTPSPEPTPTPTPAPEPTRSPHPHHGPELPGTGASAAAAGAVAVLLLVGGGVLLAARRSRGRRS